MPLTNGNDDSCVLYHTDTHTHEDEDELAYTNVHTLLYIHCTNECFSHYTSYRIYGTLNIGTVKPHRTHIVTTFSNYIVCFSHVFYISTEEYERMNFSEKNVIP